MNLDVGEMEEVVPVKKKKSFFLILKFIFTYFFYFSWKKKDIGYQVAGMQSLVNVIRSTGATNIIGLGGIAYSNSLAQV